MGDLVGKAQLLAGSRAVAAAHDGHGVGVGQRLGNSDGALRQGGVLKHAHGAVPHHSLGSLGGVGKELAALLADVETLHVVGDGVGGHGLDVDGAVNGIGEGGGDDGVHGQEELDALGLGLGHHFLAVVDLLGVEEGLAHGIALGGQEGVGHAAADDEGIHLFEEVVDDVELVGDLGAAEDGHEGTLGIGQSLAHDADFLLDEVAADGGQIVGHTGGGGVGAVGGAEGVVDKDIGQGGQLLAQLGIVLGLALFKAGVLQEHDLAVLQGGSLGLGVLTGHILGHDDGLTQQLAQAVSHDLQAQLGLVLALGLAHVGAEDDLGAVVDEILDGGQRGHDTLVAGDDAALDGHIEVAAAEYPLAFYINVFHRFLVVVHYELPPQKRHGIKLPGCHGARIEKMGELHLPQRLEDGHGHGIAEVQAPSLRPDGNAQAALRVLGEKCFRQTLGLLTEDQVAVGGKPRRGIRAGRLGGEEPEVLRAGTGEEILPAFIDLHVHQMPVVESRTLDSLVRNIKPQGLDEMEHAAGGGTGTGDIPSVGRNLRFHEHNVQHFVQRLSFHWIF